jgi:ATP-dependent DNA ligase
MHVHREGEGEVEGEGEGVVVKTLSSSYEPPRTWARERRSKKASPHSAS